MQDITGQKSATVMDYKIARAKWLDETISSNTKYLNYDEHKFLFLMFFEKFKEKQFTEENMRNKTRVKTKK